MGSFSWDLRVSHSQAPSASSIRSRVMDVAAPERGRGRPALLHALHKCLLVPSSWQPRGSCSVASTFLRREPKEHTGPGSPQGPRLTPGA